MPWKSMVHRGQKLSSDFQEGFPKGHLKSQEDSAAAVNAPLLPLFLF
jgi:hypothetical protein